MIELQLVKTLLKANNFSNYFKYIDDSKYLKYFKENNLFVYKLFLTVKELQERETKDYSVQELEAGYYGLYPASLTNEDKGVLDVIFPKIRELSDDAPTALIERFREDFHAGMILGIAHEVKEARKPFKALLEAFDTISQTEDTEPESDYAEMDLSKAIQERDSHGVLHWRLNYLNKALGPIRKGDFGFVFARPETGKTTFIISEVSNFVKQTKKPVLWVANEEESSGIVARLYSALLGVPIRDILNDPYSFHADFLLAGGSNIKIIEKATADKWLIQKKVKELNPSLLILDQIDKIHGFEAERDDLLLERKYTWAREVAKEWCPVIGICQAKGEAEGKQYLEMTDVARSQTSKQGEADFMIGIGKSNKEDLSKFRYLHILKNKLLGDKNTDPALKHSKAVVKINLDKFIYEDISYK